MANVRIDQNGVPKGPIFEPTTPLEHRNAVIAVDASDPADASWAVDASGYQQCRFDVAISGVDFANLDVQVLFWNSRQSLWFGGARYQFTSSGRHALAVEARGQVLFLKVVAFSGASFSLSADYALS